jgi:hypothetical protein
MFPGARRWQGGSRPFRILAQNNDKRKEYLAAKRHKKSHKGGDEGLGSVRNLGGISQ